MPALKLAPFASGGGGLFFFYRVPRNGCGNEFSNYLLPAVPTGIGSFHNKVLLERCIISAFFYISGIPVELSIQLSFIGYLKKYSCSKEQVNSECPHWQDCIIAQPSLVSTELGERKSMFALATAQWANGKTTQTGRNYLPMEIF